MGLVPRVKKKQKARLPTRITPELCRLLGLLHGDGNMSYGRVLFTDRERQHHKVIHKLFRKVFGIRLNLFHDKRRNSYYSHTKNKAVYDYLVDELRMPRGAVRSQLSIPSFLPRLEMSLQAEYVGGLLDAEGCVKSRQAEINFSTTSKGVYIFFKKFLARAKIEYSTYERARYKNPEYEIYIYGKERLRSFSELVRFNHPLKRKRLAKFL